MTPRATRIQSLALRGLDRARQSGASALEAAVQQIELTFGHNRLHNDRKLAVENAMCAGAGNARVRRTYAEIAFAVRPDVDTALQIVERMYRDDARDRKLRASHFVPGPHILVQWHLQEARIFLRWYRRFGDRTKFMGIVEAMTTSAVYAEAAE